MKGIRKHTQTGKWTATLYYNGKSNHIGIYKTEAEAQFNLIKEKRKLEKQGIAFGNRNENKYVDNKVMQIEVIVSKAQGIITRPLLEQCMKIVKGVSRKFRYNDEDDRADCEAYAVEVIIKNWFNYDEYKYDNPFAYYTEVVKRAFALQFKRLNKTRINTISLDWTNEEGKKIVNI